MPGNSQRIQKRAANVRLSRMAAHTLLAIAVLTATTLFAQPALQQRNQPAKPAPSSTLPTSQGKSPDAYVNELADLSRAGNADATRELARQTFRDGGIKSEIADSFGFTERIVQAEAAYRNGMHAPVHEADIVKSVNNLANAVGAPAWVHTGEGEVRKVRMRLLVAYPRLTANHEPPDDSEHYKVPSENIGPVEAAYIAITLLYQKHYNADFQFTDEEQAQNAKLDASTVKAKHLERTQIFGGLVRRQTSSASTRDLLRACDHFFDNLGIDQVATIDTTEPPISSRTVIHKEAQ